MMCAQFDDNILATGSYGRSPLHLLHLPHSLTELDATIRIWSIETGEELRKLEGHLSVSIFTEITSSRRQSFALETFSVSTQIFQRNLVV